MTLIRIFILSLLSSLAVLSATAQNSLFVEFDTPHADLIKYLESHGNVSYHTGSNKTVVANQGDNILEYRFNEKGNLYKTVLQRDFKTKQQAINYYNKLSDFHTRINGSMNNEIMSEDKIKKVVRRGSLVNELHLLKSVDNKFTVKIIKKDNDFQPSNTSLTTSLS